MLIISLILRSYSFAAAAELIELNHGIDRKVNGLGQSVCDGVGEYGHIP